MDVANQMSKALTQKITRWQNFLNTSLIKHPKFWINLGKLENQLLVKELNETHLSAPIFISGLARSGSTILLEILNQHIDTTSFCYYHFPYIHIPWLRHLFLKKHFSQLQKKTSERTHADRIKIDPLSPEAMEERIWLSFFNQLQDENYSDYLTEKDANSKFDFYYQNLIKKLLISQKGKRYLSKGNYNITRIEYLLNLFPDARIIIPIRHPIQHVASLIKQHKLFVQLENQNKRVLTHMQSVGHFEFGKTRKTINFGELENIQLIKQLRENGNEIQAYAQQWNVIYSKIKQEILNGNYKHENIQIVRFEDLCEHAEETLNKIFIHVQLSNFETIIDDWKDKLTYPNYYKIDFNQKELDSIWDITEQTASFFEYSKST